MQTKTILLKTKMEIFDGRYEQETLLGQGAFSEVWKVRDTQTGVSLALKIYNPTTGMDEDGNKILTHEFALMVNANHKNLLRPLFFATCNNRPYLILPYCSKGNIGKMIGKFDEEEAWKLLHDTASALAYLHAMNPPILHQDIKPANILLSDNGDYMLTDFGVSTQAKQSLSRVSNLDMSLLSAGTISYMAPERFSRNNLPIMANDIYSLGSTVYEMLSGVLPFGNDGGLLQRKGAEIPELPGNFSPLLKQTLEQCLAEEPWSRPTAEVLEDIANEALKHPERRNIVPEPTPAPEPPLKATVLGPSFRMDTPPSGTVINSANPYSSGNPYISKNPYVSDSQGNSGQSSKKGLWIGLAVAAILILGAGIFFLLSSNSEAQETEIAMDPAEMQKMQEQADFEAALALFNQESPDSVLAAFNQMKELADKGNPEAIFEMVKTYAWIPNDIESDRRKRLLGWDLNKYGIPVSEKINQEAVEWLQKSIDTSEANVHQCLYWLSNYYCNGIGVPEDIQKGISLLKQAKDEAEKSQDFITKEKIEKTLKQLEE